MSKKKDKNDNIEGKFVFNKGLLIFCLILLAIIIAVAIIIAKLPK